MLRKKQTNNVTIWPWNAATNGRTSKNINQQQQKREILSTSSSTSCNSTKKPEQLLQQNQTPNIMDSLSLYFSHPSTEILAA